MMGKIFVALGVMATIVASVELLPEGNWLYLGMLSLGSLLVGVGMADKEDET